MWLLLVGAFVRILTRVPARRVHRTGWANPQSLAARLNERKEACDGTSSVGSSRRFDPLPLVAPEGSAAPDRPLYRLLWRRGPSRDGARELRRLPVSVQESSTRSGVSHRTG